MLTQKPKGTKDLLPEDTLKLQYIENRIKSIFDNYGFKEIRIPVFEHTELFQRGVGETTDVVQKEMYTFEDKGGRSVTLRPEGTAGTIRAYLENGLNNKPDPTKLWYNMAMYRYENVQKGRLREFHQIGTELIGGNSYLADIEVILIGKRIFDELKINNIKINLNSIGCPKCRKNYYEILKKYIRKNLDSYCETCKSRFEKNPMRILDCKKEKCKKLNVNAPKMLDYLCDECREHFENVKDVLSYRNIDFEIDSNIVRGLDYYTKTVFEFVDSKTGLTVLGGGRYDGLIEELGGTPTPAVGFGLGIERLVEMFNETNIDIVKEKNPDLYILSLGKTENKKAIEIAEELRNQNIYVQNDLLERSFNSQMKYANKINAKFLLVIGENEISNEICKIKNMQSGKEMETSLIANEIIKILK